MRDFINLSDSISLEGDDEEMPPIEELPEPVSQTDSLLQGLDDLMFRLRSYQDGGDGDYAQGVEAGMMRAGEMIENLIARCTERETDDSGQEIS